MMREKNLSIEDSIEAKSEAALAFIGKRIAEQEAAEFDSIADESKDFKMSDELYDKMRKNIRGECERYKNSQRKKSMLKLAKACAIFLLVFITTGAVLVNTVDAVKYRFIGLVSVVKGDHIVLMPIEGEKDYLNIIPQEWRGVWYPEYIPDGFEFEEAFELAGVSKFLLFKNEENMSLRFSQIPASGSVVTLDNEDDTAEQ